jgi:hypothetical protein
VSYSELSLFAHECQWKWKLGYLDGLKRIEEYSVHFDFGTAMHEALEQHFRRVDAIPADQAQLVFAKRFQELADEHLQKYNKPLSANDRSAMLNSGHAILAAFRATPELQDFEVVHNEFRLFESIDRDDGIDIKFKGYVDLVLRGKDKRGHPLIWVCDFKTCSWGWDRETREDRWKHYQVFLYKHFICKRFDIDPRQVRCAFILLKKRPSRNAHPIEFFPVSAGPVSVQRALDVLNSSITEMAEHGKDGLFAKNRSACINRYGQTCQFFHSDLCPHDG